MNNRGFSDYEKYLLVSQHSKYAIGTYTNFIKLKEVMSTLNQMVSKHYKFQIPHIKEMEALCQFPLQ